MSNTPNQSFQAPFQVRVTPLGQPINLATNTGSRITPLPAKFEGTSAPGNAAIKTTEK